MNWSLNAIFSHNWTLFVKRCLLLVELGSELNIWFCLLLYDRFEVIVWGQGAIDDNHWLIVFFTGKFWRNAVHFLIGIVRQRTCLIQIWIGILLRGKCKFMTFWLILVNLRLLSCKVCSFGVYTTQLSKTIFSSRGCCLGSRSFHDLISLLFIWLHQGAKIVSIPIIVDWHFMSTFVDCGLLNLVMINYWTQVGGVIFNITCILNQLVLNDGTCSVCWSTLG